MDCKQRFTIFFLPVILLFLSVAAKNPERQANKILFQIANKSIDLKYSNKIRLRGGKPVFEGKSRSFDNLNFGKSGQYTFSAPDEAVSVRVVDPLKNITGIYLKNIATTGLNGKKFVGFFFDSIPGFRKGVQLWRYKPWNSWTKPVPVNDLSSLEPWDVQFFYWQYNDSLYGAAIPISGNGYRSTLGSENGKFGCKSLTYTDQCNTDSIPMMAIGFDTDPQRLFKDLYATALTMMKKGENLRIKKKFPEPFEYLGWCSWNSSDNGNNLDEKHLIESVKSFSENKFPLGWILIDDGWFNSTDSKLNATVPDHRKFPNGFKGLVSQLKTTYHLRDVGIWHAFNGYWNGINPDSEVGRHYQKELFSWEQKQRPDLENAPVVKYYFIRPTSDSLRSFYSGWHQYIKSQGITMIKVDNQLVAERMSVNNYQVWDLAESMHKALNQSVMDHFGGAMINCMDMTNDAFYNFGKTAVARCVEDYFPDEDGGVGYNLERGGAAAHVLAALYNSLYFSQMVWPDFDMFQSYNSNAGFHAVARAISGGPIYITDKPGKQKFDQLWPLITHDGKILRADQPGQITIDCLFQVQNPVPLKAWSMTGNAGLLGIWNAADADSVKGSFTVSDLKDLKGDNFAVYEHRTQKVSLIRRGEKIKIGLGRMDYRYYNLVPVNKGVAIIGLVNKYNAPKTVIESIIGKKQISVKLKEGGTFVVYLTKRPSKVLVNGKDFTSFSFKNGFIFINIPVGEGQPIEIQLNM